MYFRTQNVVCVHLDWFFYFAFNLSQFELSFYSVIQMYVYFLVLVKYVREEYKRRHGQEKAEPDTGFTAQEFLIGKQSAQSTIQVAVKIRRTVDSDLDLVIVCIR